MRKFTYKAAFYGWAGLIACVILAKIVSCVNEQNHNATDPGPDVVVREADTVQFSYNIYPSVFKIYPAPKKED